MILHSNIHTYHRPLFGMYFFVYYLFAINAVQNKTLIDKNLSKRVDLWKICYVEKSKLTPTFLTLLDEMWEGAKYRRIE